MTKISVLDFVNGVRGLRGLGPLPGLPFLDTDADDERGDVLFTALGVPAGGSESADWGPERWVLRFSDPTEAAAVADRFGLERKLSPLEVALPEAVVDLAVSGHHEVVVEDDEGWVRGWWVPHDDDVATFITPEEPLIDVPQEDHAAPAPGASLKPRLHAGDWDFAAIAAECGRAHSAYGRQRTAQYQAYFNARPELRGGHPLLARDLASALPEGWDWIAELLPEQERHRWHLSGKSSQVLALGILGPAVKEDPQLRWLEGAFGTPSPGTAPRAAFEYALAPEVLGEAPRVTAIDFFVDDPNFVLCAEAKWTESGMGRCSCRYSGGDPVTGECVQRVLDRSAYWETAREVFGLPEREIGKPCPLSPVYQAVRNAAAALALADGRPAVFALIYDDENPYFGGHGDWPGWPAVLMHTLADAAPDLSFVAVPWQSLVPALPIDDSVRAWASEKHGLD